METNNTPKSSGLKKALHSTLAFLKGGNRLLRTLLLVAVIALIVIGLGRIQYNKKNHKKISRTITQTITEVKSIKEFCTANYTEETIISVTRKRRLATDELALIVKGTVRAGFDLSQMDALPTSDTSIVIVLPQPQILDLITNPSDCETFQESGRWSHKKVTKYKEMARQRILRHAKEDGIMRYAQENGIARLRLLFSGMGFTDITISIRE